MAFGALTGMNYDNNISKISTSVSTSSINSVKTGQIANEPLLTINRQEISPKSNSITKNVITALSANGLSPGSETPNGKEVETFKDNNGYICTKYMKPDGSFTIVRKS